MTATEIATIHVTETVAGALTTNDSSGPAQLGKVVHVYPVCCCLFNHTVLTLIRV
jgi:hypothetical protein